MLVVSLGKADQLTIVEVNTCEDLAQSDMTEKCSVGRDTSICFKISIFIIMSIKKRNETMNLILLY